jgi:TPR repeat protein
VKPGAARLPPAPQLSMGHSGEPPWRGPSPFEDEVRDTQVVPDALTSVSPRMQRGPVEWLFRAAVVIFLAAIAIGALRWVLFPYLQEAEQPRVRQVQVQNPIAQGENPVAQGERSSVLRSANDKRILSQDEVDQLIDRGGAFFARGDVAAARLLLERAAEANDPRAALMLGATYDPNVLRGMNAVGIRPDPEQARSWYERAAQFGSREASERLSAFAQRAR